MCQEAEPPQGHPSTAGTPCRSMTSPKGTPSTESLHDVQDTSQELHQDSAPKSGIWRLQGAAPPRVDSADTLWKFEIAIENTPFSSLIYLFKMVIFYSYVSLPEGNFQLFLWSSPNMHLQERLASQQSVPRNVKPFVIPNSTEIRTLNIKQTLIFSSWKSIQNTGPRCWNIPPESWAWRPPQIFGRPSSKTPGWNPRDIVVPQDMQRTSPRPPLHSPHWCCLVKRSAVLVGVIKFEYQICDNYFLRYVFKWCSSTAGRDV